MISMYAFELSIIHTNELNPFSDLTYSQQWYVHPNRMVCRDPYASDAQTAYNEQCRVRDCLFNPVLNDHFMVWKLYGNKLYYVDWRYVSNHHG